MRLLLGIDIGSSSSKGVLLDERGGLVAVVQRKHEMRVPGPGLAEHDADADWWEGFCILSHRLIAEARVSPADVVAVACSGIGPCALPVDEAGQPLRPAILYGIDTRAHREIDALTGELGAQQILERCGNALTTQSVGPKIRWLRTHEPEVYARTHKLVGCPTYLVHRLTGRWTVDHYGASCVTPCYDLAAQGWNAAWTRRICPPEWLPEILWTSEVAGAVTAEAARATGLAAGTPVIAGTIDSASEAVSVGVLDPGDLMIMYGTTAFFIQVSETLAIDPRHWAAPFLFPGTWSLMGGLATSGAAVQWFRKEIARLGDEDEAFEAMVREAEASPPGARGLIALPYLSGERTPINDPLAKGVVFGLTLAHTRGDLYRALIEGVGHAVRHNLDIFAEARPPGAIYAVGGGVKDPVWMQAVCDIAGITQQVRRHTVGAALGSAFLAGVGVGVFTRQDIAWINPIDRRVSPRNEHRFRYDRDHRIYHELYERTKDLMAAI